MTTNYDIIARWVREVRKDDPKYLKPSAATVHVNWAARSKRERLYSYGTHFELARWVDAADLHDGFWLLNGDTYSVSTSRHQNETRAAVQRAGGQVLILPYSSLASAGIDLDSIAPVEVTADRWLKEQVTVASLGLVPEGNRPGGWYEKAAWATENADGSWTYTRERHVLGESVFTAEYQVYDDGVFRTVRASFLSAFDHQETTRHYFLCELPDGASPATVDEAFEALKPPAVVAAEAAGLHVTRQGDLFAVPVDVSTREVRRAGVAVRGERVLGISHAATESVTVDGETFARGILRHSPFESWRRPEHRRQRMGDGKGWHVLVKNTVPTDARGANRAWSVVGNID